MTDPKLEEGVVQEPHTPATITAEPTDTRVSLMAPIYETSGIAHLVEELQKCKLTTEAGEPVTFEISGDMLHVWAEKRTAGSAPPRQYAELLTRLADMTEQADTRIAELRELRAGNEGERAELEALRSRLEASVKQFRAEAEALAARAWPIPPSESN